MKLLGIHFAPLNLPIERRLQTLGALGWTVLMLCGAMASWFFFFWALIYSPLLRIPFLLYAAWIYWDRETVESGARRSKWVRSWRWWEYFRAYFPIELVKTSDLPPDRSYLFAAFPHGVLSVGVFSAFTTESCNFERKFPGLIPYSVTLNMHFVTPFIRELSTAMGSLPAKESCIVRKLSEKGNALGLVVGGAEEAFHSKPGEYNILLAKRKGFIRVALRSGASIVPTVVFGEPEVYDQIQCKLGSFLRWTQNGYKKLTGIAPVYLKGRGIFQYTYGLLPFRSRVTVVAGKPIHVTKVDKPSQLQIDELHEIYSKELVKLFNSEKKKYIDESTELVFC